MPQVLETRAPAKLNLGLRILGRRADGFHNLRTVFQTLALADRVRVEIHPGRGIELEIASAAPGCDVPADASNLAWRAAGLARGEFGIRGRLRLELRKRIPVGAGLGGGSSDAAAVLGLLARVARRRPPAERLFELAAALGSDVAPFLLGGTVLGQGRGDEVLPLPDLPVWHVVLAAPRGAVGAIATLEAFRRWDELGSPAPALTPAAHSATITEFYGWLGWPLPASRPKRDRGSVSAGSKVQAGLENDFQPVVFSLSADFPRIQELLLLQRAVAIGLTGSGAAQYGLFRTAVAAQNAARRLATSARTWTTRFARRDRNWGVVQW